MVLAQSNASSEGSSAVAAPNRDTVIARVGTSTVTLGELVAYRATLQPQYLELPDEVLYQTILGKLIEESLLESAAIGHRLDQTSATRLTLRNERRRVLAALYLQEMIEANVTEDRVVALYERTYQQAAPVSEIRTSHILVEDQGAAEALRAEFDAGANFATLAARHSRDATASRGGDRGWLSPEKMSPDFAAAVRSLPIGEVSPPVSTPAGWHIIRVDAKRIRPVPVLDDVRQTLRDQIAADVRREILTDLRVNTDVLDVDSKIPSSAVRDDGLLQDN